jgi:hypothetical protein
MSDPTDQTRPPVDLEAIRRARAAVEKRVREEDESLGLPDSDPDPEPVITDDNLLWALDANESGDAWIYASKNRGRICRVASMGAIIVYDPTTGLWRRDHAGVALAAVAEVAIEFKKLSVRLKNAKKS